MLSLIIEKKLLSWLNLENTKGIGPQTILKLIDKFGNPENFEKYYDEIIKSGFAKEDILSNIFTKKKINNLEKILQEIDKLSMKFLTILDSEYPESLKNIYNPPLYLFIRGNLNKDSFQIPLL